MNYKDKKTIEELEGDIMLAAFHGYRDRDAEAALEKKLKEKEEAQQE